MKLIYFSTGGSDVKEYSLGWQRIVAFFLGFLAVCLVFVFIGLALFTDILHDAQNVDLKQRNTHLKTMLAEIEAKVQALEKQVNNIQKDDKDLRIFLSMEDPGEDTRKLGRGGLAKPQSIYSKSEDEALRNANRINQLLEELENRMDFAAKSRLEIISKYNENDQKWRRMPSIRPVEGGRMTDGFGPRTHPTIGIQQFHDGLDIAAPRGTAVYAPADGRVEKVIIKYQPNQSYGRQIVIDHGNGIKTRYAHLRNIDVVEGEEVTRFSQIGTVGDTGRATGPHLHYEVIVDGEHQNPVFYILE
ncbi:M23 family metallopeptidase [candidate division KSB1 bacterium]|nr:M23 family metallopeptidase [candidate division KSB1 bacterium]